MPDSLSPSLPPPQTPRALPMVASLPAWLRADLRSDHAGETGAVYIYLGILALSRQEEVRDFASHHLYTERQHLAFFDGWLEKRDISLMIPLWRLAGWLLGASASLGGAKAVCATIDAVESFVVEHYREQVSRLLEEDAWPEIRHILQQFQDDEEHHRRDAAERTPDSHPPLPSRAWRALVDGGSRFAVKLARTL